MNTSSEAQSTIELPLIPTCYTFYNPNTEGEIMSTVSDQVATWQNVDQMDFAELMKQIEIKLMHLEKECQELADQSASYTMSQDECEMLADVDRVANLIGYELADELDDLYDSYDSYGTYDEELGDVDSERFSKREERRNRTERSNRRRLNTKKCMSRREALMFYYGYRDQDRIARNRFIQSRCGSWKSYPHKGIGDWHEVNTMLLDDNRRRNHDLESQILDYNDDKYTNVVNVGLWFGHCDICDREGTTPVWTTEVLKFYELTEAMGVYDDIPEQPWYAVPFWKKAGYNSEKEYYDDMMAFHDDPRTMAAELDDEPVSSFEPDEESAYQLSSE